MATYLTLPRNILEYDKPIEVVLIGAGGNGGEALEYLCRIHQGLLHNGREHGLHVTVIDDSIVRDSNIVRQRFWPTDIGTNKAVTLVNRYNMMMGLNWTAIPTTFPVSNEFVNDNGVTLRQMHPNGDYLLPFGIQYPDIVISAVDLPSVRCEIHNLGNKYACDSLWLDFGNKDRSGQAIMGVFGKKSKDYPNVFDHYPEIENMEDDTSKSCSAAESIRRQDLLVNPAVVVAGMNILWELLRYGKTDKNGVVISLESGHSIPLKFESNKQAA